MPLDIRTYLNPAAYSLVVLGIVLFLLSTCRCAKGRRSANSRRNCGRFQTGAEMTASSHQGAHQGYGESAGYYGQQGAPFTRPVPVHGYPTNVPTGVPTAVAVPLSSHVATGQPVNHVPATTAYATYPGQPGGFQPAAYPSNPPSPPPEAHSPREPSPSEHGEGASRKDE